MAAGPSVTGSARQPLSGGGKATSVSAASASLLWATVNVCDTDQEPNSLGIRASMPGNGLRQRMYMRFRAEYFDAATGAWAPANNAVSRWTLVGSARYRYRQGGWTFEFAQPPTGQTYTMRGKVDFQWRKRRKRRKHRRHRRSHRARWTVARRLTRQTRSGVQAVAGADPAGVSKALCLIY
ncbi:MAG: hypothetical protein ABR581_05915 [Thermoleophilaceae bacterium]